MLLALALLYVPHLLQKLAELLAQYPHPLMVCGLVYLAPLLPLLHLPLLLRVYAVHSWARLPLALLLLLQLLLACVPALLVSYLLLPMPH